MTDFPVISVVTPSYNQAEFLEETLVSVLSQEGEFILDYVVVDGGSSDGSPEIIKAYAERIEREKWPVRCRGIQYRWMSEKDRGQTDALVKGFSLANGKILAWLNSDDTYLPGTLDVVGKFFRDNPGTGLLYGDAFNCDKEGGVVGRYPVEDFDLPKLAYLNFVCQPAAFFSRQAYDEVGGLDPALHYGMDYDLFVKIGKKYTCRHLPQSLAKFRLHEASKSVREEALYDHHEEALRLALKHFGWAPLNRVYGSCYYYSLSRLPRFLRNSHLLAVGTAALCTLFRSLRLNRGIRREDLKLLNLANFRKMFQDRMEILKGQQ